MYFGCFILIGFITAIGSDAVAANPPQQASLTCAATCPDTPLANDGTQHPSAIGTDMIKQLINETKANTRAINHLKKDLCDLTDRSKTTAIVLNNILSLAEDIVGMLNDSASTPTTSLPATSCQEVKQRIPSSPSGEYQIFDADNQTQQYVYCKMETLCGSDEGWTRLAHINMTDPEENCPSGLRLYDTRADGKRGCGRPTSGRASCHSIKYPSHGIEYSRVCGRVHGYQFGGPNPVGAGDNDINTHYVDGVSLTRGSPRQHIWTFMGAPTQDRNGNSCPCATGQSNNVPSFIGNDYYCESGQTGGWLYHLYGDRLWDGENCGHLEVPCCTAPDLPWFNKQLGTTTSDYIEVRVCGDQGTGVEDTPIEQLEIYIQ